MATHTLKLTGKIAGLVDVVSNLSDFGFAPVKVDGVEAAITIEVETLTLEAENEWPAVRDEYARQGWEEEAS